MCIYMQLSLVYLMYDPYNENEQSDPHRYHQVDGQDQRVVETVTIHAGACNGLEACDSKA